VFVDRICREAPAHLSPRGVMWLVHSALCNTQRTLDILNDVGMTAEIVAKELIPFGPVMRERAPWLRANGLLGPDQRSEEILVIRARPAP